jgi:F0F1-type ATP synthase assembly protein I
MIIGTILGMVAAVYLVAKRSHDADKKALSKSKHHSNPSDDK